jgi:hypothetical protein
VKVYKITGDGKKFYKLLQIPEEFADYEVEIIIKPIKKYKSSIFSKFLKDKERVEKYKNFSREELHGREDIY